MTNEDSPSTSNEGITLTDAKGMMEDAVKVCVSLCGAAVLDA